MDDETTDDLARLRAVVTGNVQGVNFRYYTQRRARDLGVAGWIRNLPDGSVETVAEGRRPALDRLAEFLRVGPPAAQVTEVQLSWGQATGEFAGFDVRYF